MLLKKCYHKIMKSEKFEKLNLEKRDEKETKKETKTEQKIEEKELSLEEIPLEAKNILEELRKKGYEGYLVGGCVRDLLLGKKPKDYDITTNAKPKEIQKIFPHSFYENKFGTVTVVNETKNPSLKLIEITPYGVEGKYTDKRHPDEIKFAKTLKEDLERRDFTVNAMAAKIEKGKIEIIDLSNGKKDLENKVIRTVGDPNKRFQEDALRLMRAPRFAARLGFDIEKRTKTAIKENSELLSVIAKQRIKDELLEIVKSENPSRGVKMLCELKLFSNVFPEIKKELPKLDLTKEKFSLLERSRDFTSSSEIRLALFFLDIKKSQKQEIDAVKLVKSSLTSLKFPKRTIEKVISLLKAEKFVENFKNLDKEKMRRLWKLLATKRIIDDETKKTTKDFIIFQKIRQKNLGQKIEKKEKVLLDASKYPLFLTDLEIKGRDVLKTLKIKPGPEVGKILNALLEEVIKNPARNEKKYLISKAKELKQSLS